MTKHYVFQNGLAKVDGFRPEVPFLKQPKIHNEKVIEGVRYYFGNGKRYVADLFDRMFKTVKTNIKSKEYKGELIGKHFCEQAEGSLI